MNSQLDGSRKTGFSAPDVRTKNICAVLDTLMMRYATYNVDERPLCARFVVVDPTTKATIYRDIPNDTLTSRELVDRDIAQLLGDGWNELQPR